MTIFLRFEILTLFFKMLAAIILFVSSIHYSTCQNRLSGSISVGGSFPNLDMGLAESYYTTGYAGTGLSFSVASDYSLYKWLSLRTEYKFMINEYSDDILANKLYISELSSIETSAGNYKFSNIATGLHFFPVNTDKAMIGFKLMAGGLFTAPPEVKIVYPDRNIERYIARSKAFSLSYLAGFDIHFNFSEKISAGFGIDVVFAKILFKTTTDMRTSGVKELVIDFNDIKMKYLAINPKIGFIYRFNHANKNSTSP